MRIRHRGVLEAVPELFPSSSRSRQVLTLFAQCTGQSLELRLLSRVQEYAGLELHTSTTAAEEVAKGAATIVSQWKDEIVMKYGVRTASATRFTTIAAALVYLQRSTNEFARRKRQVAGARIRQMSMTFLCGAA